MNKERIKNPGGNPNFTSIVDISRYYVVVQHCITYYFIVGEVRFKLTDFSGYSFQLLLCSADEDNIYAKLSQLKQNQVKSVKNSNQCFARFRIDQSYL